MRLIAFVMLAALAGCSSAGGPAQARLRVDTRVRHQVLTGWEAHGQSGHTQPGWPQYGPRVIELAADSVGINRIRLEVKAGVENHINVFEDIRLGRVTGDGYRCHRWRNENDNADPNVFDWTGFHFDEVDEIVERVILPLQQRLRARGESLIVNLQHTAFIRHCGRDQLIPYVHLDPEEYAELMLAAYIHLRDKYLLVPQMLEIILEPDNIPPVGGRQIGQAAVAVKRRLAAAGFHPVIIAPSTSRAMLAPRYLTEALAVPGAREAITDFSYHRYGLGRSRDMLPLIDSIGKRYGYRTAMLEWIGADYRNLEEDLSIANVSAWQQFALAFPTEDNGAQYIVIENNQARLGSRTRFLRQYFRYLPLSTQRIGVEGGTDDVSPLAFQRPDSGLVVVVRTEKKAEVEIGGLAPGAYEVTWTLERGEGAMGPMQADSAGTVRVSMPAAGVFTLFASRPAAAR